MHSKSFEQLICVGIEVKKLYLWLLMLTNHCFYLLSHPFVLAKVEQLLVLLLCVCLCLCICHCLWSQSNGVGIISQEVVSVAVQSCIRQLVRTMLACSLAHLLNTAMSSPLPCCFLLSSVDY